MWLYTIHHCRVLVIVITITSWWPHLVISSTSTLDTFSETSNTLWYINAIFVALLAYVIPSLSLSFIIAQGFKREWAPFVLTPDFVWVMGGEVYLAECDPLNEVFVAKISLQDSSTFETYKNLCCRAFLILRRHSDLIINLFSLVSSC